LLICSGKGEVMNLLKKKTRMSPQAAKVAGASVVAFIAVGAIVLVAHQATPASNATATVKPVAVGQPVAEPAKKTAAPAKGKTANAKGVVQTPQIVTVTGCLEEKNDAFRLKNTDGADAPKSRSWKTLGMTKHASSLTLVDTTKRLKLASHVGQRVSVTGALNDKELDLKSLKSVGPSCD
jgi:hypothetical protein